MGASEALIHLIRSKNKSPKFGLEIGVARGRTSYKLLRAFPNLYLFLIDPYHAYKDSSNGSKSSKLQQISRRTTAIKKLARFEDRYELFEEESHRVSWQISDHSLDFIYVDGLHTNHGCMLDIVLYAPKVKRSGLVSGHDFNRDSVKDAVISYSNLVTIPMVIKTTKTNNIWYYE